MDFCGRRIHINKSFRLILSISSLPPNPSTSQLLSCRFNFINASSSSLPLAQELALHEAQRDNNSEAYSLDGYTALTSAIVESDKGRRELSERLLKCLGKVTDGVVDSFVVSEVEEVMKNYDEVHVQYYKHTESIVYHWKVHVQYMYNWNCIECQTQSGNFYCMKPYLVNYCSGHWVELFLLLTFFHMIL